MRLKFNKQLRSIWLAFMFWGLSFILIMAAFFILPLPIPQKPQHLLLLSSYALLPALLASFLMARYSRRFKSLGFEPKGFTKLFGGILIGFSMISIFLLIGLGSGFIKILGYRGMDLSLFLTYLMGFLGAAATEEVLFRGYVLEVLMGIGALPAVVLTSLVFGLLHYLNPSVTWLGLLNIGLAGMLFALAYIKTRSLWMPIGIHFSWNFFQFVYSLPVSGVAFEGPLEVELIGPAYLCGGGFGPEGSLISTAIIGVALAVVYKLPTLTRASIMIPL